MYETLCWICLFFRAVVLTYQEHHGVTYISFTEDPCPRMLIHNKCPVPLLLRETVKGRNNISFVLITRFLDILILFLFIYFTFQRLPGQ